MPPKARHAFITSTTDSGKPVHPGDSFATLIVPAPKREIEMRESPMRRVLNATIFALALGGLVYFVNPADRLKADLRADAHGLVLSLEYSANLLNQG